MRDLGEYTIAWYSVSCAVLSVKGLGITRIIVSDRRPVFAVAMRFMMPRTLSVSASPGASIVKVNTLPTIRLVQSG